MSRDVVVVLPYAGRRVLMQLRDAKEGISCPGSWGFFGGSMDGRETPAASARREVLEELGYAPRSLRKLHTGRIRDLGNIRSHAYYCPLTVSLEALVLREGMDLGLFSRQEIRTRALYSARMRRSFPVAPTTYIVETVDRLWQRIRARAAVHKEGARHGQSV